MNQHSKITKPRMKTLLLSTALVAGIAGVGIGQSGMLSPTPSFADPVKVEAPTTFSFGDVVEAVSPAVVSVRVETKFEPASDTGEHNFSGPGEELFKRFFGERAPEGFRRHRGPSKRYGQSQGSGFFVSDDGYLVTNNHVVENGNKFTIVLNDGTEYDAKLVGTDPRTDLAVLKVDTDQEFAYVDFGSKRPRTGDWVVAVGNPFGLGGTVTAGIVSAHGRDIGATRYDDFIQIDAAVNKGNSGGPAFNLNGEVIGINTAIFSPSGGNVGIAFAIPAALAKEVVHDLIEDGNVTRGWLGVQIQPVTKEISESLGLELENGAIVTSAQEDSPAALAHLESGDIIAQVNGEDIKGPKELARKIADQDPGATVTLKVWRDGEASDVEVKLGNLQDATGELKLANSNSAPHGSGLGLALKPSKDGLQVMEVDPEGPAAKTGIREGDIISGINGEELANIKDLRKSLDAAKEKGRKSALFQIKRRDRFMFVPVPIDQG